jgi:hypothetical protein
MVPSRWAGGVAPGYLKPRGNQPADHQLCHYCFRDRPHGTSKTATITITTVLTQSDSKQRHPTLQPAYHRAIPTMLQVRDAVLPPCAANAPCGARDSAHSDAGASSALHGHTASGLLQGESHFGWVKELCCWRKIWRYFNCSLSCCWGSMVAKRQSDPTRA